MESNLITLNKEQESVLNELKGFIEDKDKKFFLLTGLAGTGKTFLVTYLLTLPELSKKKIATTGCTNKAVGVLESLFTKNINLAINQDQNNLNIAFLTIHKLLQIKRKINKNGEEFFESMIDENNIKIRAKSIFYYDVIIIDEVSMLNRDMVLQLLKLQNKIKGKIIFLGDKAQLPPVSEEESMIFELANKKITQASLSTIMRSDDQIIALVNSIRNLIYNPEHKVPFIKLASLSNNRIVIYRNENEWLNKYNDTDEIDQIILCYTNKRVEYLNKRIRKTDSADNYISGEKIIFNSSYHLTTNKNRYDSSQMVLIKTVDIDEIDIIPLIKDDGCNICQAKEYDSSLMCGHNYCKGCFYGWELNLQTGECPLCNKYVSSILNELKMKRKYKIWMIMLENKDLLYVIHPDDKSRYMNDVENVKNKLRDMNNYITKHFKLNTDIMLRVWEYHYYNYIDQFAQINYGNAITTHRSQGSTYKRVYIDLIDIIKSNDNKKEGFQCLYTAVTRASEYLYILL
jgi:hypothetical protein